MCISRRIWRAFDCEAVVREQTEYREPVGIVSRYTLPHEPGGMRQLVFDVAMLE